MPVGKIAKNTVRLEGLSAYESAAFYFFHGFMEKKFVSLKWILRMNEKSFLFLFY